MSLMNQAPADAAPTAPPATDGAPPAASVTPPATVTPPADGAPPAAAPGAEENGFKTPRPDFVPEKFWDADKATVRHEDVFKSYTELEKALTKAKEPPKAPEKYEYKVPEELAKDFGLESIDPNDPYLTSFQEFAKTKGFTQEQHDDFVNFYMRMDLESARKNLVSEFGKLGDESKATQRIKTLHQWGATHLAPAERQVMSQMIQSAAGVELFEKIVKLSTSQRQIADVNGNIEQGLTQQDLDAMMNDDRYHDRNHPEYASHRKKVDDAFKRLYPDK